MTVGTDRWDYSLSTAESARTTFHFPNSTTKHMKCFFSIDPDQPFASSSFTDLAAQSWVEKSYINPTSGSNDWRNAGSAFLIISLAATLSGILAF